MRAIDVTWPKTVRIGAVDWKIVIATEPPRVLESRSYFGAAESARLVITIEANLALPRAIETFMHELLHACFRDRGFPDRGEEAVVTCLSPSLLCLWRDNPDLHPWMMRHLTKTRR